ncbi:MULTISPECIES: hypothetical protein [Pseudomonadaceae]|uniref:hypothetical protein n=1 Tax=Pseudomonadaceae TaxID=135621 RepID=UPI000344C2DC|nr:MULTISPECIES: hypothetical protein [Pseudomonas]NNB18060.1 hypothetical protein [Pseudomonas fragi]NNB22942.1 hypothetical protein [Pseudomonas fragi]HEJ3361500.1 hypothetical protein [Pseudomonas aeruginosa]
MSTIFIADTLIELQQAAGFKGLHLISPFLKFTTLARKPKWHPRKGETPEGFRPLGDILSLVFQ